MHTLKLIITAFCETHPEKNITFFWQASHSNPIQKRLGITSDSNTRTSTPSAPCSPKNRPVDAYANDTAVYHHPPSQTTRNTPSTQCAHYLLRTLCTLCALTGCIPINLGNNGWLQSGRRAIRKAYIYTRIHPVIHSHTHTRKHAHTHENTHTTDTHAHTHTHPCMWV